MMTQTKPPATLLSLPDNLLADVLGLRHSLRNCMACTCICRRLRNVGIAAAVDRASEPDALCTAAEAGSAAAVRALLSAGADAGRHTGDGKLPLHHAVVQGHLPVVRLLLDVELVAEHLQQAAPNAAATHTCTPLAAAAANGHVAVVSALIAAGADPSLQSELQGHHAMWLAIRNGHVAVVRALVAAGAVSMDGNQPDDSLTPLHEAAYYNRYEMVRPLVAAGIPLEVADGQESALRIAVRRGAMHAICALLIAGANPNSRAETGCATLHTAAYRDVPAAVPFLVAAGADIGMQNNFGNTPLQNAQMRNHPEVAMALLKAGADAGSSYNGESLRSWAAANGYGQLLRMCSPLHGSAADSGGQQ